MDYRIAPPDKYRGVKGYLIGYDGDAADVVIDFTKLRPKDVRALAYDPQMPDMNKKYIYKENMRFFQEACEAGKCKKGNKVFPCLDKEKTIALVGAGPSATKFNDELNTREDIEVVSTNRAAKAIERGYVFATDRLCMPEWYPHNESQALVTVPWSSWHLIDLDWKDIYIFDTDMETDTYFKRKGYPYVYTSDLCMASMLHFAFMAGFKRIELFGNDYAWVGDSYYSDGNQHWTDDGGSKVVLNVNGKEWITDRRLYNACRKITKLCEFLSNAGIEVINRSEGIFDWGRDGSK